MGFGFGDIVKVVSRVAVGVVTGGASEVVRAAGGSKITEFTERQAANVFLPGLTPDTAVLAPSVGAAVGGTVGGTPGAVVGFAIGSGIRQLIAPPPSSVPQPFIVNTISPEFRNAEHNGPTVTGPGAVAGPPFFGKVAPFLSTGGNPAWLSLGSSVRLSAQPSVPSAVCSGGQWEQSATSVRLLCPA